MMSGSRNIASIQQNRQQKVSSVYVYTIYDTITMFTREQQALMHTNMSMSLICVEIPLLYATRFPSSVQIHDHHLFKYMTIICSNTWPSSVQMHDHHQFKYMTIICSNTWPSSVQIHDHHLFKYMTIICSNTWPSSAQIHDHHLFKYMIICSNTWPSSGNSRPHIWLHYSPLSSTRKHQ